MTVSANTTQAPDLEALPSEEVLHYQTDEHLPPLRLNATRVPERLSSSTSALQGLRRRSNEWCRSRSRSPSLRETENSSLSSIDTESDIYTDRMGLEELDVEKMHNRSIADGSISSLPPVNERLSEDTLDDCHAFSDLKATGSASSRANSLATGGDVGSLLLETLDECDDEDLEAVHISNLDEIHEESENQNLEDLPNEERATYFFTTEDLPPFRLNSLRVVDRLSHSHSSFFPDASAAAGKNPSKSGDGRRVSLPDAGKARSVGGDSISSMENLNQDILLDKMGFQELDSEKTRQIVESMSNSVSSLQPVNERMDQETMDDVHAFSDVHSKASSSGHSRANSVATGDVGSLLETLEEVGEEDEPDDGNEVHISNLENLTIHESEMNGHTKPSDATT